MRVEGDVRVVRMSISSPGDVASERGRAQAVAAKLNRQYAGHVKFKVALSEEGKTDQTILDPAACDILVTILWTGLGASLPQSFPCMADGRPYPSVTAYELLSALESAKHNGAPDVYVFRKTADPQQPATGFQRHRRAQVQLDALDAFWSDCYQTHGQFMAAIRTFVRIDAFEELLELMLRRWLETRGYLDPRLAWAIEKGSPFDGVPETEATTLDTAARSVLELSQDHGSLKRHLETPMCDATLLQTQDALLGSWSPDAAAMEASREFVQIRIHVEDTAPLLTSPRERLTQSNILLNAGELSANAGRELPARRRQRQMIMALMAAALLLAILGAATITGVLTYRSQQEIGAAK